jgi:hypothetical protein
MFTRLDCSKHLHVQIRRYTSLILYRNPRCRVYRRPKALMHEEQGRLQPPRRKKPASKVSLAGAQAFFRPESDHLDACGVDHFDQLKH